ncbi:hypothetical protein HK405_003147 [Cladochytrium tenue]|nr:hypothetical protein HK405_003147 [Cladochytrium tenue]
MHKGIQERGRSQGRTSLASAVTLILATAASFPCFAAASPISGCTSSVTSTAAVASTTSATSTSAATTSASTYGVTNPEVCDGCTNTGNKVDPPVVYASDPTVAVMNGSYAGVYLSGVAASANPGGIPVNHPQDLFLGIPYAQSPPPRFARSQSLNTSWTGVLPAKRYGYHCYGVGYNDDYDPPYITFALSEDCLTINVVRPHGYEQGADLPVITWFHGGGFVYGGSSDHRFNGSWIVDRSVELGQPVIFTSINYRKGRLGFPHGDAAISEDIQNLGLYDQWIQENIGYFGGDPSKVIVQGESAGAGSVFHHLAAYGGRNDGLFRGAIAESGYWATQLQTTDVLALNNEGWDYFMESAGCTQGGAAAIACARQVSFATIIKAVIASNTNRTDSYTPTVDGDMVMTDLQVSFRTGAFVENVPLLITANSDEGTNFGTTGINNETALASALNSSFPLGTLTDAALASILAEYPNVPGLGCPFSAGDGLLSTGTMDRRSLAIAGDLVMVGPRREVCQVFSAKVGSKVYAGRFDQLAEGMAITTGATHAAELPFVFRNPQATSRNPLGNATLNLELASQMNAYWVSFAATLDPNEVRETDAPEWPEYAASSGKILTLTNKANGVSTFQELDNFRQEGIQVVMDTRYTAF